MHLPGADEAGGEGSSRRMVRQRTDLPLPEFADDTQGLAAGDGERHVIGGAQASPPWRNSTTRS